MNKNYFLKYFLFNKILLHLCGVLPLETWGFIPNAISIFLPYCSTSFLVSPVFFTYFFRTLDSETAMTIFSVLLQGVAATFKGYNVLEICFSLYFLRLYFYFNVFNNFTVFNNFNVFNNFSMISMFSIFSALLLLPKRRQLQKLVSLCSDLWKSVSSEEEAQVAKHYARRGMYFTYFFTFIVFTALINILVQSLFDDYYVVNANGTMISSRVLPYPTGLIHENIKIYSIWYVLQIPAGMFIVILIVGIDTAVVVFVLHTCAYFRVLQFRLAKFKEQCCEKEPKKRELSDETIFREIVTIVEFHQSILRLV